MSIENKKPFDKFKGLKIMAAGFVAALFGVLLFAIKIHGIGYVFIYSGFATGFVGMVIHMKAFYLTVIKKGE